MSGPLEGYRIVEMGGMGPSTWCAMLLADAGAEVIRVDRPADCEIYGSDDRPYEYGYLRGRRSIAIDVRRPEGAEAVRRLIDRADAVIEGNRPGVMERLGLGPDVCLGRNPRLVYGRMTGWGQDGPLAQSPGHDINYLALTGLLHAIGPRERPLPPLNLVGDYGGGGMLLAFGLVAALLETARTGQGQVIDASMVEGSTLLGALFYSLRQRGELALERGANLLDGGAPFYGTYETADGRWVSIGTYEDKFYRVLVEAMGLRPDELPDRWDRAAWPELSARFAAVFRTRTRDEWTERLQGLETCYSPVLDLDEAMRHPQHVARRAFVQVGDELQPAPAPRFSRTPAEVSSPPALPGEHTVPVLEEWGFDGAEVRALFAAGAAAVHPEVARRDGGHGSASP